MSLTLLANLFTSPPSHYLLQLFLIIVCATIILSNSFECRWRFDTCELVRGGSPKNDCSVVLRQWCDCSDGNSSSSRECSTNRTRREDVNESSVILSSQNSTSSISLLTLCNITDCYAFGGPCEWGPWRTIGTSCTWRQSIRRRSRCCDPVTGEAVNRRNCRRYYSAIDVDFGSSNDIDCIKKKKINKKTNRKSDNQDDDSYKTSNETSESDYENTSGTVFTIVGVIFIIMSLCCFVARVTRPKRRRNVSQPVTSVTVPLRPVKTKPDVIFYPEPGHPVSVNRLPNHFQS